VVQAISFGAHIIDALGWPFKGIPAGQQVSIIDRIKFTVAGTAAAPAMNLAKLGVDVAAVGRIGTDLVGDFLSSALAGYGADVSRLIRQPGRQTSASLLPIRLDGSRPAMHVIGANADLGERDVPWDLVRQGVVFHLGGIGILPGIDGPAAARILRRAKELGAVTTVDVILTPRPDLKELVGPALAQTDYFLPNIEEAGLLVGTEDRDKIAAWLGQTGLGAALLTLGEDGVLVAPSGQPARELPAYAVEVVDSTGCGDAFSAGFISGLVDGLELLAAAERGLAAGALVATDLGSDAGLVSLAQLEAFRAATPRR
jgi:sugar/nucleoside kinase (ribokinase family)